ncbi:hypothetical protein OAF42_03555 [Planctomicrobium sp.]|nr:hypothetical protein [Planctomicrobium sp.]MDB4733499.1 hypothetical protein [Planctomicrobium sp.]MDB4802704.1 hypothetical protein [bacterium]
MFSRSYILIFTLLVLPVLSGCTPEPNRDATELKSASEVKITAGESRPEPEEAEEVANESTTTPPASETQESDAKGDAADSENTVNDESVKEPKQETETKKNRIQNPTVTGW